MNKYAKSNVLFSISFLEAICKKMRLNGKKPPKSILRQLQMCEQELARLEHSHC